MDCVGAAIWAAGMMVALAAVGDLMAGAAVLEQARGAVAGALGARWRLWPYCRPHPLRRAGGHSP